MWTCDSLEAIEQVIAFKAIEQVIASYWTSDILEAIELVIASYRTCEVLLFKIKRHAGTYKCQYDT